MSDLFSIFGKQSLYEIFNLESNASREKSVYLYFIFMRAYSTFPTNILSITSTCVKSCKFHPPTNLSSFTNVNRCVSVKVAYRDLCLKLHPDRTSTNDCEKFQAMQKAYEVLMNPAKRHKYDTDGTVDQKEVIYIVTDEIADKCRKKYAGKLVNNIFLPYIFTAILHILRFKDQRLKNKQSEMRTTKDVEV